ncbi:major facilitator superfamily domain-containing protein [Mucor mucedo]|uniref:major facilitator superfamily domain-containing protein n=1 Tax=Mucor mucedo TaxID=29922 RepID=UPI00221F0C39|nr:major facilitator superfamily domain-containing protein [Mucor mucedo]KAI7892323.1 major facilitator superfamily domain-containing protein [Mucor mucedo]
MKAESIKLDSEKNTQDEKLESCSVDSLPFVQSDAEKKLVKKINYTFMPFVCVLLFIQYIDKSTISMISVIPEFYTDTGLTKDKYTWLGSFFYVGFLCMQLPNNYLLQKVQVSKYAGICLVLWGIVLLCMAFGKNFGQLAGLRFLLGFFEAITYPTIFLLISTIYRRSEQVIWLGVMFISNSVAGVLGGFIGVGIMKMPIVGIITPWKWAFILFGSITIVIGISYFFFLPDRPDSRWFRLTEEEKLIVQERTRDNAVVATQKINFSHFWEAVKEPRFYCYSLISVFINLQNGAFTIFSNIIITELGFSNTNAILLNIPTNVTIIILILISTNISKSKGEIIYVAMVCCFISMVGLICLTAIPSGGVKLIGIYLQSGGTPTYVLLQASITSNVSGYTKKIFYIGANLICYTVGNFVGPLLLRQKDSPRYYPAMGVYVAANVLVIILFGYVRYTYICANKKRNNLDKNAIALTGEIKDLTDVENPNFVYKP